MTRAPAGWVGLLAGTLFGVGLVLGGMTDPAKVRGFLDFFGAWDPTLMFVMGGAVSVHWLAYRWTRGRKAPVIASAFQVPSRKDIDLKLIAGAALFGAGWGLGGYCPGPAVASLPSGAPSVLAFVAAMLAASFLTGRAEAALARAQVAASAGDARAVRGPGRSSPERS